MDHIECVTFLVPGQSCVHLAASAGHIEALQALIYFGADVNAKVRRQLLLLIKRMTDEMNDEIDPFNQIKNNAAVIFILDN